VKKNKLASSKLLVAKGANINHQDTEGTPILHLAVNNQSLNMVKLLVENKANLKARDKYGLTAYVYALKKGDADIVKIIKDAGGKY
jgi:uncharacterized protein